MAETTIAWCDYTFNPWVGCQRVSPGCEHCYAEAYDKRVGGAKVADTSAGVTMSYKTLRWGPRAPRVRTKTWREPLKWNGQAKAEGVRRRVFCASLADVFEDRPELVPWRADLFHLIANTPHLDWLLLTKRPENILRLHPERHLVERWETRWPNVWLGTTIEDQQRANERIPELLKVPAAVRFLSCEPLLERVDLSYWLDEDKNGFLWRDGNAVQWIIIGGESGPGARPFHVNWARDLLRQCRAAGVAPFVKQLGSRPRADFYDEGYRQLFEAEGIELPDPIGWDERAGQPRPGCSPMDVSGKDRAGADPAEWPEDLRVREWPEVRRG